MPLKFEVRRSPDTLKVFNSVIFKFGKNANQKQG